MGNENQDYGIPEFGASNASLTGLGKNITAEPPETYDGAWLHRSGAGLHLSRDMWGQFAVGTPPTL